MDRTKSLSGTALAIEAAGTLLTAVATPSFAQVGKIIHCEGVNACKGNNNCKTARNACKGQRFAALTVDQCKQVGGTPETKKETAHQKQISLVSHCRVRT